MPKDTDRLVRQLSLVSLLLSQRRPVTTREIHRSTEGYALMTPVAFTKRFYDDRSDLRQAGIVIESTAEGDGDGEAYYLPEENYLLPDLHLEDQEIAALMVAFTMLQGRFAYARPLRLALAGLTRGRPDMAWEAHEPPRVVLDPDTEADRLGDTLARLDDACIRGKTVVFPYRTAADAEATRTVDPYCLARIAGHWYVAGKDHDRDDMRMFRLSRVVGPVRFLSKKPRDFTVPGDFDPGEFRARPPWLLGPQSGTARVWVDGDLAWWVLRSYPSTNWEGEDPTGGSLLAIPYADGRALVSWVVGLESRAELLEPAELRQAAAAAMESVHQAHLAPAPHLSAIGFDDGQGADRHQTATAKEPQRPRASQPAAIPPERLSRVLSLLSYVLEPGRGPRLALADVQRDLGLTRGEVQDDVALLNLVNHGGGTYLLYAELEGDEIVVDREPEGESMARPARISPLIARALLMALDLVGDALPPATSRALTTARAKVETLVGGAPLPAPVAVEDVVPSDKEIFRTLNEALNERRVAAIEYFTSTRGELTTREIEPHRLYHERGAWYLDAHCLLAAAERTFRLALVRSASITHKTFVSRAGAQARTWEPASEPSVPAGPHWAWVSFPRERIHLLEEQGFEVRLEDETARARIPYLDERWLVREVLRHLGEAVLLFPGETRTRVAAAAESLGARYAAPVPEGMGIVRSDSSRPERQGS